jgi:hypothetical protein
MLKIFTKIQQFCKLILTKALSCLNFIVILLFLIATVSCHTGNMGFFQPITLNMEVPEGPVEYRAGWYSGCRSALANSSFANAWVYKKDGGPDLGDPQYQGKPFFHKGWGQGWFSCILHVGTFTSRPSFQHSLFR